MYFSYFKYDKHKSKLTHSFCVNISNFLLFIHLFVFFNKILKYKDVIIIYSY